MTANEVEELKQRGDYNPKAIYMSNEHIHCAIDAMFRGFGGHAYNEVPGSLIGTDPYMVPADFEDYVRAQVLSAEIYTDRRKWARMALFKTACSGNFFADRAIREYAENIWHCQLVSGME